MSLSHHTPIHPDFGQPTVPWFVATSKRTLLLFSMGNPPGSYLCTNVRKRDTPCSMDKLFVDVPLRSYHNHTTGFRSYLRRNILTHKRLTAPSFQSVFPDLTDHPLHPWGLLLLNGPFFFIYLIEQIIPGESADTPMFCTSLWTSPHNSQALSDF